jgi:hypothetical protein
MAQEKNKILSAANDEYAENKLSKQKLTIDIKPQSSELLRLII